MTSLGDPNLFVEGAPHELLADLRRTEPISFQAMDGEPGFWAVLTHGEVMEVARQPLLYSASEGGVVLENLDPEQLVMMRNMLLAMDPPDHGRIRKPLTEHFKARVMAGLEDDIRTICRSIMSEAAERSGEEIEFVHEVTAGLPAAVIGRLMGLPEADWGQLNIWAEQSTSGQDPDLAAPADAAEADPSAAAVDMAMYALALAGDRRGRDPEPDLTSVVLGTDFGGRPMDDAEFASFFVQLVTAGNDTTKTMLSSGLLALLQHPDQLAEVRGDPGLISSAVEEILRWANPLHYFRRTTTAPTRLRGVEIAAGDKVAMYYTSANRDEDVFDDAQRFDIHRNPNHHLSFGFAEHFCLGVHLARLEGRVFFEELLNRFGHIELAGEPVRVRSNLNNALKRLPVLLSV